MARHTKQIYFNQSQNGSMMYIGAGGNYNWVPIPTESDLLYHAIGSPVSLGYDNSEFPVNKQIVSTTVKIYNNEAYNHFPVVFEAMATYPDGTKSPNYTQLSSLPVGLLSVNVPDLSTNSGVKIRYANVQNPPPPYTYNTFQSTRAATNKPYIEVIYDDLPPLKPSGLSPNGGTINPRDAIRFSWTHKSQEQGTQKSFTLEYSTNNWSTKTTITETTSNEYYDFAASTFPSSGTLVWRVKTVDANDEESEFATSTFTLGTLPQLPPVLVRPVRQYVDGSFDIRFMWDYIPNSQTSTQASYDLQYSTNNGVSWVTINGSGATNYHDVSAGTFPSGNILWKLRVTNNYSEVSDYTEAVSFTVIGRPPNPIITNVTNAARPLITWNSEQQNVYDIQVTQSGNLIYESGSIARAADRTFQIPIYLEDGTYRARLKIINEFDLSSDWVERQFTISTTKPTKPILTASNADYYVMLQIEEPGLINMIYRDGEYIGQTNNLWYADFAAANNAAHSYIVRAIDENDTFNTSDPVTATLRFAGNTIAVNDNPSDYIVIKYGFNDFIQKSGEMTLRNEVNYYDGREYPIAEFSEHTQESNSIGGFVETLEELNKIKQLLKHRKPILYRDNEQGNITGVISGIQHSTTRFGYNVSLSITRVVI